MEGCEECRGTEVHVYMVLCNSMCIYTHTHARTRTHTRAHTHTRTHAHTHTHTHTHTIPVSTICTQAVPILETVKYSTAVRDTIDLMIRVCQHRAESTVQWVFTSLL